MKYANTKVASKKQEKRIAKEMNARVTVASGALDFQKADVRNDRYLVEAKTTEKSFYPLSLSTWEKIEDQALHDGIRIPVMCIDLNDGKESLAILHHHDFDALRCGFSDKYHFVGTPPLTAKKSIRIRDNILEVIFIDDLKLPTINFQRIKFENGLELIVLDWSDFLLLQGE